MGINGTESTDLDFEVEVPEVDTSTDVSGSTEPSEPSEPNPAFVSREELTNILSRQERMYQSRLDKATSRLERQLANSLAAVEQTINAASAAGMNYTDEQKMQIRNAAINQAIMEAAKTAPEEPLKPAPKPQVPNQVATQAQIVSQIAADMVNAAGIEIRPSDPEAKLIRTTGVTPVEYLESVRKAIAAYKERIPETPPNPAGALNGVGAQGTGAGSVEAIQQELSNLLAHPTVANRARIQELKQKLIKATAQNK